MVRIPIPIVNCCLRSPEIHLSRRDANDEFVTLRVNFALIRKESGFISGLVAVLHDATEQEKKSANAVSSYQMLVTNCGRL